MPVSVQELKRRKQLICDAMAKEDVDVIVIGGSDKWEQRGLLRYLTDYYVPIFEEYVVLPVNGPLTFFAHYSYGAKHSTHYPAIEHADFIPLHDLYSDPGKKIAEYIRKFRPKKVGIGNRTGISADFYVSLVHHLGSIQMVNFTSKINEVRMSKSEEEVRLSEQAIRLNEDTFFAYLKGVKEGSREIDAITEASYFARKAGSEDQYWMVGSGLTPAQCSIPLAMEKNHRWKKGELNVVIIEIAGAGGHFGEIAHLISIGDPAPEVQKAFTAVSEAAKLAGKAISPGVPVGHVADVVNQYLAQTGYYPKDEENKAKSTTGNLIGHGQGLDTLEIPVVMSGDPTIIQPGTRINIHPNVALSNGVRVMCCDCYVSTETGSRNLSNMPHEVIAV